MHTKDKQIVSQQFEITIKEAAMEMEIYQLKIREKTICNVHYKNKYYYASIISINQ